VVLNTMDLLYSSMIKNDDYSHNVLLELVVLYVQGAWHSPKHEAPLIYVQGAWHSAKHEAPLILPRSLNVNEWCLVFWWMPHSLNVYEWCLVFWWMPQQAMYYYLISMTQLAETLIWGDVTHSGETRLYLGTDHLTWRGVMVLYLYILVFTYISI
jgi:hypothetical protein